MQLRASHFHNHQVIIFYHIYIYIYLYWIYCIYFIYTYILYIYIFYILIYYINIYIYIYIYTYTYKYIYIHIYIYIYIYTYTCNHENNVPSRYHCNEFVVTYGLGHMTYGYTLLLPMNQRVRNKLGEERNISVIYYAHLTSVTFEPSVFRKSLKWPLILHSLPSLLSTVWFIGTVPAICSRTSLKSVLFKSFLLPALFAPIMFVKMKKLKSNWAVT